MTTRLRNWLILLVVFLGFIAGSLWSRAQVDQTAREAQPVAYAWRDQLSVYHPSQKKLFVYSELGGHLCIRLHLEHSGRSHRAPELQVT